MPENSTEEKNTKVHYHLSARIEYDENASNGTTTINHNFTNLNNSMLPRILETTLSAKIIQANNNKKLKDFDNNIKKYTHINIGEHTYKLIHSNNYSLRIKDRNILSIKPIPQKYIFYRKSIINNNDIEKEFEITINTPYINQSNNSNIFNKLKKYSHIKIKETKKTLALSPKPSEFLRIDNCPDNVGETKQEYTFSGYSVDDLGNIDKTYSGDTTKVFKTNDSSASQYYHGGSIIEYNPEIIQKGQSFTLFYSKRNDGDLENENLILVGLGKIQNKIGILETNNADRKGKLYCYNHYTTENNNTKYFLFRFPYQELLEIKEENIEEAKIFLEECKLELQIEAGDTSFFFGQSKVIPTSIVLKYTQRIYEQIMKLKQNKVLWGYVRTIANAREWHFCNQVSIDFLKLSIQELRKVQKNQKNPGLWALKDYFQISQTEIRFNEDNQENSNHNKFIQMCSGENVEGFDLDKLFFTKEEQKSAKEFILKKLIHYPIINPLTVERILIHLGIKLEFSISSEPRDLFSYNISNLTFNDIRLSDLIEKVNTNKNLYSDEDSKYDNDKHRINTLNKYLNDKTISFSKELFAKGVEEKNISLNDKLAFYFKLNIDDPLIVLEDISINPYLLFEKYIQNNDAPLLLDDIDWGEKIIQGDDFKFDNIFRLRAIIVEYIKKQENQTGHVWVSYEDAQEYLNDRLFELDGKLDKFYTIKSLMDRDNLNSIFKEENGFLTLKEFANREKFIKKEITALMQSSQTKKAKVLEEQEKLKQENPNNKFIESDFSLIKMKNLDFVFISGVAGSGKSHTLCKYLDILLEEKITDFKVLTPSGKAADVLKNKIKNSKDDFKNIWNHFYTEENDKETEHISKISTADRYIVDSGKFWDQKLFARVDKNNSKATEDSDLVLIIDEISMITLDTLYYILKIKQPKKLIILGDIKQLPPIGYGSLATSIYNHLFLESSFQDICLAKMETSHRADDNSLFIKHSLTLRDKSKQLKEEDLKKEDKSKNFILQVYSNETLEKMLEKIYSKEMLEKIYSKEMLEKIYSKEMLEKIYSKEMLKKINSEENGSDIFKANIQALNKEIQILTPNRIGDSGTNAINNIFIKALEEEKVGLKFIYNKNDKKSGLTNGNIGYIDKDKDKDKEIDFDGKEVYFSESQLGSDYDYGFAITVHKSQGSGFPIVILVLPEKNNSLITKELIYTALTRPEEKMYILYHEKNIKALTQLPSIPHRNMNLFDRDKLLWIKDEIEYPIKYNDIEYRRKQDLYFALMLEYSGKKNVEYRKNGSFIWEIGDEEILLMPKFYIEEKQDEKSFKYLKSIDLRKVYKNFEFKLDDIEYDQLPKRYNENKKDIIEDNNDSIEIITHNGLRTRSWSEAILMLIFDKLQIPYFYEVEIRREKHTNNEEINTYKLTYPNPEDSGNYRIPDFTIATGPQGNFGEDTVTISDIKCIIEHLGMLTNESYLSKWKEKVKDYYEKYKFDIVAPLSSLNFENGDYTIGKKWEIGKDEATNNEDGEKKLNICFTTDEKDLEDIPTLIKKLELLKEFYFPKQESK